MIRPCAWSGGPPLLLRPPGDRAGHDLAGPGGLKGLLQQGVLDVTGVETGDPAVLMMRIRRRTIAACYTIKAACGATGSCGWTCS